MKINRKNITQYLDNFDFESLFIEELGWDYPQDNSDKYIPVDEQIFTLTPIADKRGFNVFLCLLENQSIPLSSTLKKIDKEVSKYSYEHFIIYASQLDKNQKWQWVKKEANQPLANRTVEYSQHKKEALLQVLDTIAVDLDEEENLNLLEVKSKAKKAFDVDKVTKKFYDKFKKEHSQFLGFIEGIDVDFDKEWYASLMLNRLMFVYFIQKKGFLNSDLNYLKNKLNECQQQKGQDKFYSFYRYFLLRLFHDGLGSQNRTPELDTLLGKVPYLNGGLFEIHPLENKYPKIEIKDEAFEKIFTFFDQYNWHLDERPLKSDNEINPDVLGYIFEKYINQKQMGAYYTKEDITEYISKNCIIPYLFDSVNQDLLSHLSAQEVQNNLGFYLLSDNPDRYIYDAVKKGVDLPLPDDIAKGINDVSQRENWNITADENYALPTEIWREFIARRNRFLEVREKLTNGEITSINDLITYNLNIRQFAQDAISGINSPLTLKIFYEKLSTMSILDPTCGSGAFLFAALNILEPLYDACLERMQTFIDEETSLKLDSKEKKYLKEFQGILANVRSHLHDNTAKHCHSEQSEESTRYFATLRSAQYDIFYTSARKYFILKNIMLNNLYGVDIMEEATEICKLRLFLKLASQVTPNPNAKNYGIEPLPDIDFNIRCGNSLVGFANYNEVEKAVKGDSQTKLDLFDDMTVINDKAKAVSEVYQTFRSIQTQSDGASFTETKQRLQNSLARLNDELNNYLAKEYGIDVNKKKDYEKWLTSHQPFHWFTEFYAIINNGGFDVIIGNPPYVEYSKVKKDYEIKGYETEKCGNLYAFCVERFLKLQNINKRYGVIIPLSSISTDRMSDLQEIFIKKTELSWFSFYAERPSKLFEGVEVTLSIVLGKITNQINNFIYTSKYYKWESDYRDSLFSLIDYHSSKEFYQKGSIVKAGTNIEMNIITKLKQQKDIIGKFYNRKGQYHVYYRNAGGRYYKVILNFEPEFILNGQITKSSTYCNLSFDSEEMQNLVFAVMNSTLFYWYWVIYSDNWHMINRDIKFFSIGKFSNDLKLKILELCDQLKQSQLDFSVKRIEKRNKGQDTVEFLQFNIRNSKSIIDEIDRVLAEHYGFTDEELDFIINYDIKYRMGKELDSD
jgi:hypothetical protein